MSLHISSIYTNVNIIITTNNIYIMFTSHGYKRE